MNNNNQKEWPLTPFFIIGLICFLFCLHLIGIFISQSVKWFIGVTVVIVMLACIFVWPKPKQKK